VEPELVSQISPILLEDVEGGYFAPFLGKGGNSLSSGIIFTLKLIKS